MDKLAVVVGHNSKGQGAVRSDTGETEYAFNNRVAAYMMQMAAEFGIIIEVFHREYTGSFSREIVAVYNKVDKFNPLASMELHFNGHSDKSASGTEVLSSGSVKSLVFAKEMQESLISAFGMKDRGVKTIGGKSRGGKSLISGKAPAILVEPFFGSNPSDLLKTDEPNEVRALARSYLSATRKAFDRFPRKNLDNSRTIQAAATQRTTSKVQAGALSTAVVLEAVSQVREDLEALPIVPGFEVDMTTISLILGVVAIGLSFYNNLKSSQIVAARVDDHEKGIR